MYDQLSVFAGCIHKAGVQSSTFGMGVLREFSEHLPTEFRGVRFIHGDASHALDGISVKGREQPWPGKHSGQSEAC